MQSRDLDYLLDILEAARLIQTFLFNIDQATFSTDVMRQDAVMRRLEIIGEASRRLSEEARMTLAQFPWSEMISMRNRLIHGYNAVNLDIVWSTVKEDIPLLITELENIFPPEESV